jgi:hypothetical protein
MRQEFRGDYHLAADFRPFVVFRGINYLNGIRNKLFSIFIIQRIGLFMHCIDFHPYSYQNET